MPVRRDRPFARRSTRIGNYTSLNKKKKKMRNSDQAICACFHPQLTIIQGYNLHLNFGGHIWEILEAPRILV